MRQSPPQLELAQDCLAVTGVLSNANIVHNAFRMLPELAKRTTLVVDLGKLTQVDSAGLAWIINLLRDAKSQQITVELRNTPDKLLHLAALSNADTLLTEQGLSS
jgi:phospholipid transport system transporter-binding protein